MKMPPLTPVHILVVLLLHGCSDSASGPSTVVHDSAGVRVVESIRGGWTDEIGWRVDPRPFRTIGRVEGESPYVLHRVRGAVMLADGRVLLADAGSLEIRLFDPAGAFVRSFGRQGSGPGEFSDIAMLTRFGSDSLLIFDRDLQRVTIVSADLQGVARVSPIAGVEGVGRPTVRAALPDGSLIGRANAPSGSGGATSMWQDSVVVIRFAPDGSEPRVLFGTRGDDRYSLVENGTAMHNNHPLGRLTAFATDGQRLFVAAGGDIGFDVYSAAGALEQRFRINRPARPVDEQVIDDLTSSWQALDPDPSSSGEVEQFIRAMPMPSTLPGVDRIQVDASGHVWLRSFEVAQPEHATWYVFSADDTGYLGAVSLPGSLEVTDIGPDFVLGIGRTAVGAEQVQIFSLTTGGDAGAVGDTDSGSTHPEGPATASSPPAPRGVPWSPWSSYGTEAVSRATSTNLRNRRRTRRREFRQPNRRPRP